jgi:hypothetical protein
MLFRKPWDKISKVDLIFYITFLGSEGIMQAYFSRSTFVFGLWSLIFGIFTPKSIFFLQLYKIPDDISHAHTDFGAQIPVLGCKGLLSPFLPPKVYLLLLCINFPIDDFETWLLRRWISFYCTQITDFPPFYPQSVDRLSNFQAPVQPSVTLYHTQQNHLQIHQKKCKKKNP